MNEVNENATVNGAGVQGEELAAKNNETKAEHDETLSDVWDESIKAGTQITEEYQEGREKVMEYKDFVEQVKEQIQDFLPEKFADCSHVSGTLY